MAKPAYFDSPIVCSFEIHPILKKYFGYCLVKAGQRLRALLDKELRQIGIGISELSTMRIIELSGPTSQIEIGRYLGMDRASVVKLIDGMERRGVVRRTSHSKDRRIKLVALTAKGVPFLEKATRIRNHCEKDFLRPLNKAEQETLRRLLPKLLE